mgnify:CR=1 FL=1
MSNTKQIVPIVIAAIVTFFVISVVREFTQSTLIIFLCGIITYSVAWSLLGGKLKGTNNSKLNDDD